MTIDQNAEVPLQRVTEQRVQNQPSGEARKGVNVLNTSDPSHPAINPFVPIENQTVAQTTDQNASQSSQADQGNNGKSGE
jgi:hypothetical protein